MLYSFSDSSWTGPGQDSIVVTVCAKQPAAGLGVVKHTTFSLPSPTPRSLVKGQLGYGQKSMGLGGSGRWWPSKEWGLWLAPPMKPLAAVFSPREALSNHTGHS